MNAEAEKWREINGLTSEGTGTQKSRGRNWKQNVTQQEELERRRAEEGIERRSSHGVVERRGRS